MRVFIWIDAWQQQCCGDDFGVGSDITWPAVALETPGGWPGVLLEQAWAEKVGYHQETHDDDARTVELVGTVRSIREVTCRRAPQRQGSGQVMVPIAGSGVLTEVAVADKWRPEPPDPSGRVSFNGWIVGLELRQQPGSPA